jgi:hypothetical protein
VDWLSFLHLRGGNRFIIEFSARGVKGTLDGCPKINRLKEPTKHIRFQTSKPYCQRFQTTNETQRNRQAPEISPSSIIFQWMGVWPSGSEGYFLGMKVVESCRLSVAVDQPGIQLFAQAPHTNAFQPCPTLSRDVYHWKVRGIHLQ